MQGLDSWEAEELSWCPSWSNSLWQGWSCGLVHCPGGNATEPIWRVLASSLGISSWTRLKPQHSISCWLSVQWEHSVCESCQCCKKKKRSSKVWMDLLCLAFLGLGEPACFYWEPYLWVIAVDPAFMTWHFSSLKQNFIAYPKVQIAFLKFTSCDNQALVGCIPIPAVAVDLNLKS